MALAVLLIVPHPFLLYRNRGHPRLPGASMFGLVSRSMHRWRSAGHLRPVLSAVAACAFSASPAAAQHDMSAMGNSATKFGTVAFANSGSRDAQPAFLRGLALLHNF